VPEQKKNIVYDGMLFDFINPGFPIIYNSNIKKFVPGNDLTNGNAFVGWYIDYEKQ